MKVDGLKAVKTVLEELQDEATKDQVTYVVGYTQNYALAVHENPTSARSQKRGKSNKYLEKPARNDEQNIARVVRETYEQTKSLDQALMVGGLYLQRISQEIVPIDTGALRVSAFTAHEDDLEEVATAAYAASEARREAVIANRKGDREKANVASKKNWAYKKQKDQLQKLKLQNRANRKKRNSRSK